VSQTGTISRVGAGRARLGGVRGNPALTLLAVALGVIMVALDGTIVAVANPAIQANLHASLAEIQWVTNGYLLALAVTLITIGKFGDRFGHRNVFLIGIGGFGATSAAVGLSGDIAHSIGLVIAFRVAQGVFGAMLQPTALALLRSTFPVQQLSTAIGVWGAAIGAATAAGPIVGGLLVQHINWESIFYINVPVGAIALVMGLIVLKRTHPSRGAGSFDALGTLLLSAALFLLVWGLIKGSGYGWGSGETWAFFGGAALAGALFVLIESRAREPLLPLRLFRSVPLSAGTVLVLALMFALFGAMFFMTFYLENVRGLDAVAAGVRLIPLTAMLIVGSPIAGALISKVGPRFPMVGGMLLAAAGLFGLSRVGVASGLNDTIGWFVLLGLGLSPVIVGTTDVIVGNAAREMAGVAGGLQSTAMQVGGTLGTAVLGAVMSARVSSLLPAKWAAAHLPHLTAAQMAQLKSAVDVGVAPVPRGTPPQFAALLTNISHTTFVSGMTEAFGVAGIVAVVGAAIGLLTRQGRLAEGEAVVAAGHAEASAAAPQFTAQTAAGVASGEGSPARDGALAGIVRGSGGTPLGGASVTIVDSAGAQVARGVTADDGRYSIHGVRPGTYTTLVIAPRHHPAATGLTLAAGQRRDLDLTLGQEGTAVLPAGSGISAAGWRCPRARRRGTRGPPSRGRRTPGRSPP
jgi:EmrB/QacA subfamily drug resistance transporter